MAVAVINVRLDGTWGRGIHLVITALACALVLGMGACGPREKQKAKQTTTTPPKAPQTPAKK